MTAPATPNDPHQPDEDLAQLIFSRGGAIPALVFSLFALFWLPGVLGIDPDTQQALAVCVPLASGPLLMTVAGFGYSIVARSQPVAMATSLWAILTAAPFVGWLGHILFGHPLVTAAFAALVAPVLGFVTITLPIMLLVPSPRPATNRHQPAGPTPASGPTMKLAHPSQQPQDPENNQT